MNFNKYNGEGKILPKKQTDKQLIDLTSWTGNEEIEPYKEGARAKNRITCPEDISFSFSFLIPKHSYLFKQSSQRYPEQFWVEVIAYRLGCLMGIPVPPAFVGIDTKRNIAGAVIEWFFNYPGESREEYIPGGDLFQRLNSEYDRKKGKDHNLTDLIKIIKERNLEKSWEEVWAKIFCFDAIIGNTDRHQDNWGIVSIGNKDYFAPAFDNGTAMGHEIIQENILKKLVNIEKYVDSQKATHHIKYHPSGDRMRHVGFLSKLIGEYPSMKVYMRECIDFSIESFQQEMNELKNLSALLTFPNSELTSERADFIIKLVECRQKKILGILY